jgi:hypothetical protein
MKNKPEKFSLQREKILLLFDKGDCVPAVGPKNSTRGLLIFNYNIRSFRKSRNPFSKGFLAVGDTV